MTELLTVEDCFLIEGRGVVVSPDFPVPPGWKNRTETVTVLKVDGKQYEATAQFNRSHINLIDPGAPAEKRWRVVVLLLDKKKEDLPAGSKVLVSQTVQDSILPRKVD